MSRLKEDAEYYRYCLIAGVASVESVVEWADGIVASDSEIDPGIAEAALSGARSPSDLASILHLVSGEADNVRVMRRLFGAMYVKLKSRPDLGESMARALYDLRRSGDLPEEEFGWEPHAMIHEYREPLLGGRERNWGVSEAFMLYLKDHALMNEAEE